jgi:uncharacterized repeat protein (TIGR03803 family)
MNGGDIFGVAPSTVFQLSPDGKGGWNPSVIHTFTGGTKDGSAAQGAPKPDRAGNLYGTTSSGGAKNNGTVYKLSPILTGKKKGTWTEKILYSFKGGTKDGGGPQAGVVLDAGGNIYGTTVNGGKSGDGTVFELVAPVGKAAYKEKILWSFNRTDGAYPYASLIVDSADNLFGTTAGGGTGAPCPAGGCGVTFEVIP